MTKIMEVWLTNAARNSLKIQASARRKNVFKKSLQSVSGCFKVRPKHNTQINEQLGS